MPSNLAAYFAEKSQKQNPKLNTNLNNADGSSKMNREYDSEDDMGPTTSMAVEAEDDDSFERSTFNLKRTRSMGLLDDYIDPTKKLLGRTDDETKKKNDNTNTETNDNDEDNDKGKEEGNAGHDNKDYGKGKGNYDYDDNDDYNSDSSSSDSDNNNYDYQDEGQQLQRYDSYNSDESLSPSVSPPPADKDNFLLPQDDNDLLREPERHVDYLSHDWNESEISNSWKYIILRKKKKNEDLVNAARLENASWRTWAKARNHLKTVSPEAVNWSKDSDVTWLYGPIVRGSDNNDGENIEMGYGSDDETSKRLTTTKMRKKKSNLASSSPSSTSSATPKPILKKRSVTEIIEENSLWKLNEARKHINDLKYLSAKHGRDDYDDYDALAAKVNAQYYQKLNENNEQSETEKKAESSDTVESNLTPISSDNIVPNDEIDGDKQQSPTLDDQKNRSIQFGDDKEEKENIALSGILSSSNHNKYEQTQKDRHIHFNDRVQQCMAIGRTFSGSDTSESEASDEDTIEGREDDRNGLLGSDEHSRAAAASHVEDRSVSSSDGDLDEDEDEDEDDEDDNAGLFINPTMSRRTESNSHYSITDTSSQSSAQSKISINPIIRILPATTLNYGSDDEASDNSDFNGSYGNAVSHNVNTYRGYDYMYDYNSVYTGDTSSFLPVDNCDVLDLPEGLNLHGAMASDNASNYELNQSIPSPSGSSISRQSTNHNRDTIYHENETDSLNSGDQFIENSMNRSSDEEEDDDNDNEDNDYEKKGDDRDGLSLQRTASFGKNTISNSLRDLRKQSSSSSLKSATTRSFISGQPLVPTEDTGTTKNCSSDPSVPVSSSGKSSADTRPRFLKRNSSSSNFIFDSDSDRESDDGSTLTNQAKLNGSSLQYKRQTNNKDNSALPILTDSSKGALPQSTTITPSLASNTSSTSPPTSELSKSIKIKNSSPPEVRSSDVAISGSFSPLYGSAKSIAAKKGILHKSTTKDLREVNKNLEDYHIDENSNDSRLSNVNINQGSNESVQKMMQNAKDIAQKYLHSWKKTDGKQTDQKSDILNRL